MAGAVAIIGSVAAIGLPGTPAHATGTVTSVTLPLSGFSHLVLDPAHQHVFISSADSNEILVTDYSGNTVATIANEPGADGLVLSSDGSTVYAALSTGDAVSAISTSTLTETARYSTGTGTQDDPVDLAYTGGDVWFSYGTGWNGGIGTVNPSSSPATVSLNTIGVTGTWYSAPVLAAAPNGALVAGAPNQSPVQLTSFNVSCGCAHQLAAATLSYPAYTSTSSNLNDLAITPDGNDVVVASSAPYVHQILQVSNLAQVGQYTTGAYPIAVSIASDGTVAAGSDSVGVSLFAPGGSSPLASYTFGDSVIPAGGVAITPDASNLVVVSGVDSPYDTWAPTLNIITDPVQGPSTLSLTAPATAKRHQPITLTGTLGGTSPYAGGQTLQVTRIDQAHPTGIALPDVTTAADGSFTITDTPPNFRGRSEKVTYQVSYAGDAHLTAATASASVTVRAGG
jgi:hypothetical protein